MSHVFPRHTRDEVPKAIYGEGCYLIDASGKRYFDGSGGAAVSCLGHSDQEIITAIQEQVGTLAFAHTRFFTSDPSEKLANLLIEKHGIYIQPVFHPTVPKGDERFRVTITPRHEASDIDHFLNALDDVWKSMDLKRAEPTEAEKTAVSRIY